MASKKPKLTHGEDDLESKSCSTHSNQKVQMFCCDCDETVCHECMAMEHRGHQLDTIRNVIDNKRKQILECLEEKSYFEYDFSIPSVRRNKQYYSDEIKKLTKNITERKILWKQHIDEIANSLIDDLNSTAEADLQQLKDKENMLVNEPEDLVKAYKEKTKTMDVMSLVKLLDELKEQTKSDKILSHITPPIFTGKIIEAEKLKDSFGRIVKEAAEVSPNFVQSESYALNDDIDTSTVTEITPEQAYITNVATVGVNSAWIQFKNLSHISNVMMHYNRHGQILQKLELDFRTENMTITSTGDLLITDVESNQIKKLTSAGFILFADVSPNTIAGICSTLNNDILVCLMIPPEKTDNILRLYFTGEPGKILRLSSTGEEKGTIQYGSDNKPLFMQYDDDNDPLYSYPHLVKENVNLDICVANANDLIVVDKTAKFRFRYTSPCGKNDFGKARLVGLECDQNGCILLSYREIHCIHILDMEGNLMKVLSKRNVFPLSTPWGISVNHKGELWVSNRSSKIKIIKYRSL